MTQCFVNSEFFISTGFADSASCLKQLLLIIDNEFLYIAKIPLLLQ